MIKKTSAVVYLAIALAFWIPQSALADTRVVASIKPIHSIAAAIMDGVGEPALIVKGFESVHDYQPKPSDAKLLEEADVVVWIGPDLESSISTAIRNLSKNAISVELSKVNGLTLLEFRESHVHHDEDEHGEDHEEEDEDHEGDDHEEEKEDEDHEGEREDDDHGEEREGDDHEEEKEDEDHEGEREEDGHDEERDDGDEHGEEHDEDQDMHEEGELDMHVWLDVSNAILMADEIARVLIVAYPQHSDIFDSNRKSLLEKLHGLELELEKQADSIRERPYIVFHDAYQYLEKSLGLESVAAVTLNPTITPGVGQINEIREAVIETGAICAFAEPQFSPGILKVIGEGTELKMGMLDPLGYDVEAGPNAYFEIMRNMITALRDCLT